MALEDILALTTKLEDKELKEKIESSVKGLNKEKGQALSDLMGIKGEIESLKGDNSELKKTTTTYKDLAKALSESNLGVEDISKVAKKLKVQKDHEDEVAEMKRLLEEQSTELKAFRSEKETQTLKDALMPKLKETVETLKDKEGNKVMIAERFIPYDDLLKPIDTENPTLVQDRIDKALDKGLEEQGKFMKETGMTFNGQAIHDVQTGDRHYGGNKEFDPNQHLEAMQKSGGSIEAGANVFAELRTAKEKVKG